MNLTHNCLYTDDLSGSRLYRPQIKLLSLLSKQNKLNNSIHYNSNKLYLELWMSICKNNKGSKQNYTYSL